MSEFAKEVLPVNLVDEMRSSYLDYAMSVIVGRALPETGAPPRPLFHAQTGQRLEQKIRQIRDHRR